MPNHDFQDKNVLTPFFRCFRGQIMRRCAPGVFIKQAFQFILRDIRATMIRIIESWAGPLRRTRSELAWCILGFWALMIAGCGALDSPSPPAGGSVKTITPDNTLSLNTDPSIKPTASYPDLLSRASINELKIEAVEGPIRLGSAKNEWSSVLLRINRIPGQLELVLPVLGQNRTPLERTKYQVYQILPVPVDINQAGFVRHTGLPAAVESLPRALLPMTVRDGKVALTQTRNPDEPIFLWVDVWIPPDALTGRYSGNFSLVEQKPAGNPPVPGPISIANLSMTIDVSDFVLPDDRHLVMVGRVDWNLLTRLWPERFEVIQPNLLSRKDKNHAQAIQTLDQMQILAQAHRVQIHVPRLQPTVKWPVLQPPRIDWDDFDGVISPWMNGSAFEDQVPLGYWPLPKIDFLDNFALQPRLEYYAAAAAHFDQLDWLNRAPVILGEELTGRASVDQRLTLSAEAQRVLQAHPRLRVQLPLELDEIQLADQRNPLLISPLLTGRLNCLSPGLISSSPIRKWPENLDRPQTWLRTDFGGLMPYSGTGSLSDIRVWSWMAALRGARVIEWGSCLPTQPNLIEPSEPSENIWFYPGEWFGADQIIPTVQLKWLRQAQQDYEYLYLARERGSLLNILPMARVLTKPVEIQPGQVPDPIYSLLIGTADPLAWQDASELLRRIIMIRGPGITEDANALASLNLETLRWIEPLEKPVILPRQTDWSVGVPEPGFAGPWVNLKLGIDIYNASDTNLNENELGFAKSPPGWIYLPQPTAIPKLNVYQVQRQQMNARIDPIRVRSNEHFPVEIRFRSGFSGQLTPFEFIAPVSRSLRRVAPLRINGSLDDWLAEDAIQNGPMVKMLSRPSVQQHRLEYADTPAQIYTAWSDSDFYLAFRVEGLGNLKKVLAARNFIDYQSGRAWGEDVCQVVVQSVYEDGTTGPLLHVAVKPGGNVWVERRLDPRFHVNPWENFNPAVRYASTVETTIWRGELAIPWSSLVAEEKNAEFQSKGQPNRPVFLKLNFIQHKRSTGESASWAGPVDIGRDDRFTGVLILKEVERSDTPVDFR